MRTVANGRRTSRTCFTIPLLGIVIAVGRAAGGCPVPFLLLFRFRNACLPAGLSLHLKYCSNSAREAMMTLPNLLTDTPATTPRFALTKTRRLVYLTAGLAFLAIAIAGIFLPGIPTTGPLIAACFFLTKCDPTWREWLCTNRLVGPYMKFVDSSVKMPWKAKLLSIAMMWTGISIGTLLLLKRFECPALVFMTMISAGIVGTIFIAVYREEDRCAKLFKIFNGQDLVWRDISLCMPFVSLLIEYASKRN